MFVRINISYDICAATLMLVLLIIHMAKKKTSILQNVMFFVFTLMALITTVFSLMCSVTAMQSTDLNLKILINFGYIFFHNLRAFSFALYVITIMEASLKNMSFKLRAAVVMPIILSVFATLIMIKSSDYWNAFINFREGYFEYIIYIVSAYYLAFGVFFATFNKELANRDFRIAIYLYLIFIVGANIMQYSMPIIPTVGNSDVTFIPIENFGAALCSILIFSTIQKSEEFIDSLTGLFNEDSFSRMFLINSKAKKSFSVIIVYVEDIKMLIQAFGIDKINSIRKDVADFLETIAPKNAFCLSMSTFAVILDDLNDKDLKQYIQKIEDEFEKKWGEENYGIYISARILDIKIPRDVDSLELVYNYIDYLKGLDNSKKWIISAKDVSLKDTKRRIAVENAIKRAIENDSFTVFYQPIYSIDENKIVSAEALVRLTDDELGYISPAEFIPISEQNGTILKIGEIVFDKVCSFMAKNNLNKKGIEYIEINLSVVQCMQESLAVDFLKIMKKYGIENCRVNLEITETAAAYSPKMLIKNMKSLFENGVCFSLDDFGTGYSNINSLMNLPLDMIKFDKSMIDMATNHDKGKIILGSSIAMVKRMDLKIVAEGVETREQMEMFAAMGIDYLQGYYFSKPVCEEDFLKYIKNFKGIEGV